MPIHALIGNLFESKAQTLVNTVNCVGIMGKGIAQEFKKRYPEMFKDYNDRCTKGEVQLGKPYIFKSLYEDKAIINFPTKKHMLCFTRKLNNRFVTRGKPKCIRINNFSSSRAHNWDNTGTMPYKLPRKSDTFNTGNATSNTKNYFFVRKPVAFYSPYFICRMHIMITKKIYYYFLSYYYY